MTIIRNLEQELIEEFKANSNIEAVLKIGSMSKDYRVPKKDVFDIDITYCLKNLEPKNVAPIVRKTQEIASRLSSDELEVYSDFMAVPKKPEIKEGIQRCMIHGLILSKELVENGDYTQGFTNRMKSQNSVILGQTPRYITDSKELDIEAVSKEAGALINFLDLSNQGKSSRWGKSFDDNGFGYYPNEVLSFPITLKYTTIMSACNYLVATKNLLFKGVGNTEVLDEFEDVCPHKLGYVPKLVYQRTQNLEDECRDLYELGRNFLQAQSNL